MTLNEGYGIALARFGLSRGEFLKLTPIEFFYALKTSNEVEVDRVRPIAEAIRMEAWWFVNTQLDKKKRIRKKEKIMSFPWDPKEKRQTQQEMRNQLLQIASSTKNHKRRPVTKAIGIGTKKKR